MSENILTVKDLKTYFYTASGIAKAVDGVSFNIAKGETMGIVGESGSGKSVTSSSIIRLLPPRTGKIVGGSIEFEGKDVLALSKKELNDFRGKDIAVIFQDPMTSLDPVFKIGKQMTEMIMAHQNVTKDEAWKRAVEALSKGSLGQYSAVLQNSFRFAVFPKRLITFNPMQYVVKRIKGDEYELFTEDGTGDLPAETPTISHEQYLALNELLKKKHNPALLPIQIAYFAGLRIGEVCGLTWQDIDLKEQCLTIRRSMRYDSVRKKTQIGPTKRKKIRTVDFCDTLAAILREAKKEQMLNSIKYGPLYSQNYYRIVKEKNRTYYEVYSLPRTETPPEGYTQVSFVCLRSDGAYEAPATVSSVCRYSRKKIGDMDDFHFHLLRHTYTTNLLSHGAAPKDVQELLGHSDVSTTMNIYAHATREAKRTSARLLDKVVGTA